VGVILESRKKRGQSKCVEKIVCTDPSGWRKSLPSLRGRGGGRGSISITINGGAEFFSFSEEKTVREREKNERRFQFVDSLRRGVFSSATGGEKEEIKR